MLMLTIYIAILIPLLICFHKDIMKTEGIYINLFILKNISPYIFLLDILKYLNTACFIRGTIINDRIMIFQNYFRERFICDLISILTLFLYDKYHIFNNNFGLIFYYFRFYFGLHMIGKIRESFLLKDKIHAFINIVIIISFICFFAHIFSCLWYFIGVNENDAERESWI